MGALVIAAPMRIEAALIRSALGGARVHTTGMGAPRARAAASMLGAQPGAGLLVLGFCGGLDEHARPGDVVVAQELWAADEQNGGERIRCEGAGPLTAALAGAGMRVRSGPIASVRRLALGQRRAELHAAGAIAVDMESAWLAEGRQGRPLGVVRVVLDSPSHELLRPGLVISGPRAARALRRVAAAAVNGWEPDE